MSGFAPINDDHAVETVVFQLILDTPLSGSTLHMISSNHDLWRDDLPALTQAGATGLAVLPQLMGQVQLGPLAFAHLRPDGSASWQMRIDQNSITVVSTRYTRWARIWSVAKSLFQRVLAVALEDAAFKECHIAAVRLQVVDRFIGSEGDYSVSSLFNLSSGYLPERVLEMGPVWHSDTGWFAPSVGNGPTLNTLNVALTRLGEGEASPESSLSAAVTHAQEARLSDAIPVDPIVNATCAIEDRFATLHLANKAIVTEILSDRVGHQIGLLSRSGEG